MRELSEQERDHYGSLLEELRNLTLLTSADMSRRGMLSVGTLLVEAHDSLSRACEVFDLQVLQATGQPDGQSCERSQSEAGISTADAGASAAPSRNDVACQFMDAGNPCPVPVLSGPHKSPRMVETAREVPSGCEVSPSSPAPAHTLSMLEHNAFPKGRW